MRLFATTALALALALPALANDRPGEGVTVRPILPTQIEEHLQHLVLFRALEDLGYTIAPPNEAEYQTIHLAVGAGDADFTAVSWDVLHHAFFEEAGGEAVMTKVGTLIDGAVQGYMVDKASYDAGVTDLSMLKDPEVAKRFDADGDGKADLAGCIPGWGCERVIETHLDALGLRDTVAHNQGAYPAMIADAMARLANGGSIIYYTWVPYWVAGELVPGKDAEWISVPEGTPLPDGATANTVYNGKNLGFAVDSIRVVARNDFLEANPAARALFETAKIDINDISAEALRIKNGEDKPEDLQRHADEWIAAHRAEYDAWLAAARAAAQ
ncbi:MAG: glycine betaine/L-proline ABC transporter substrate-binding protein ProX [Rhodobacteraceae bacterium]|nr:glycine betaine/L-proline ABC transporter substrate-binding protein ProX [Paracoccaceae bacterium]